MLHIISNISSRQEKEGTMVQEVIYPAKSDFVDLNEIAFTFNDIHSVVDAFYTQVQQDLLLKIPFQSVQNWSHHVERLTHFWWIRFGGKPYLDAMYNPVEKHFLAGFNQEYLSCWLALFKQTLEAKLLPEQAQIWTLVSERMGGALMMKDQFYRNEKPYQYIK